jgi:hypothetical protein
MKQVLFQKGGHMSRKHIFAFITMYVLIVLFMLFVFFFVQKEYGVDPTRPYQRRFFIKLPMLENTGMRISQKKLNNYSDFDKMIFNVFNSHTL